MDPACTQVGSGINFSVDQEAQSLPTVQIPTGGGDNFELSATVGQGESIYFIVDPGLDSSCDSLLIILEITGGERTPN